MHPIPIQPGQAVGLLLDVSERQAICDSLVIPDEYINRVHNADPKKPEVPFTLDELDDFIGYVAADANHEVKRSRKAILDQVFGKIHCLLYPEDDDHVMSEYELPLDLEQEAVDRMNTFADQMEQICQLAGIDFEEVLEGMQPTQIRPEDTVALNISPAEKEMLLDLSSMSDSIKDSIKGAPKNRRKFEFTLSAITHMENVVSVAIEQCSDKSMLKKWRRLDRKLLDIQSSYTCDADGDHNLLRRLSGGDVSRGAVIRDLLIKMVNERKMRRTQT